MKKMNRTDLILIAASLIVGTNNLVIYLTEHRENIYQLIFYVAAFYIFGIGFFLVMKKNPKPIKLYSVVFTVVGISSLLMGGFGNATGIYFLCLAIYIYDKDIARYLIYFFIVFTIIIKYLFVGMTFVQGLNLFVIIICIFATYYDFIHPKKPEIKSTPKIDEQTMEILQFLLAGYSPKEIGDMCDIALTTDAVRKRIQRVKKEYRCTSNEQLIYTLCKNRIILS